MPYSPSNNPLDSHVNSEWMRICKCVLPYLDRNLQRNLAVSLKFMELMSVLQLYSNTSTLDPISLTRSTHWEKELLSSIRSALSPDKAFMIDAMLKLSEAKHILADHNESNKQDISEDIPLNPSIVPSPKEQNNSFSAESMMDTLSPLLDDNQKQLIKLFTSFMKP